MSCVGLHRVLPLSSFSGIVMSRLSTERMQQPFLINMAAALDGLENLNERETRKAEEDDKSSER